MLPEAYASDVTWTWSDEGSWEKLYCTVGKMLGEIYSGEPRAKKAKCDQQKVYNERRKEKPRKPQFSLNF